MCLAQHWVDVLCLLKWHIKRGAFTQSWFNVGPASSTLDQHWISIGWMRRVCWGVVYDRGVDTSVMRLYQRSLYPARFDGDHPGILPAKTKDTTDRETRKWTPQPTPPQQEMLGWERPWKANTYYSTVPLWAAGDHPLTQVIITGSTQNKLTCGRLDQRIFLKTPRNRFFSNFSHLRRSVAQRLDPRTGQVEKNISFRNVTSHSILDKGRGSYIIENCALSAICKVFDLWQQKLGKDITAYISYDFESVWTFVVMSQLYRCEVTFFTN